MLKTDCQKFDLSLIGDEKLCLPRALTIPSPSSLLSSPYRSLPSLRVGISQYSPQQLDTIPRNSHESSPTHHDEALSRTNSLHDSLWDGALPVLEENLEIPEEFITKEFLDSTLFSEAIPFILHEPITIELNPQEHIDMNSKMYTEIENLVGNSIEDIEVIDTQSSTSVCESPLMDNPDYVHSPAITPPSINLDTIFPSISCLLNSTPPINLLEQDSMVDFTSATSMELLSSKTTNLQEPVLCPCCSENMTVEHVCESGDDPSDALNSEYSTPSSPTKPSPIPSKCIPAEHSNDVIITNNCIYSSLF